MITPKNTIPSSLRSPPERVAYRIARMVETMLKDSGLDDPKFAVMLLENNPAGDVTFVANLLPEELDQVIASLEKIFMTRAAARN